MIASLTFLLWFLLVACLYKYYQNLKFVKQYSGIPTPPKCYPIIGHAHFFLGKPEKLVKVINTLSKKFDRMMAFWLGPYYTVFMYDPRDVEVILKASKDTKKSKQYEFIRPWLGDSILLSEGAKFRRNKKLIVQSFHLNNLKKYLCIMNDQAKNMVHALQNEAEKGEFDVHDHLRLGTIRTLLETTLGIDKETLTTTDAIDYARAVEKVGRLVHIRTYKAWLYPEIIFRFSRLKREQDKQIKILNELTNHVIHKRKMDYYVNRKSKGFLIDTFLESTKENGERFTDEEIKDEVMTIMFAGQDTTTASIGFTLSLLGIYHDVQGRVVDELLSIFGESGRTVTYEDIQSMKYLEQVIQESWRLYPPIPLIARTVLNDIHLDNNWILPKNCNVAIILMMLHRNPNYFPHPQRFDPDNFLPERIKARHPYSFLPFSSSSRACIGPKYAMMVIKVFVSTILRSYKVHSEKTTKDFVLAAEMSLKRKGGYPISLERRKTIVEDDQNKNVIQS